MAAAVGRFGLPFLGTNVAIAFLASRMGGWLVCLVVSEITLPVGVVEAVGRSCLSSGLAASDAAPAVGVVGGLAYKSSTISATSSIVRVELRCASFNQSTVFSSAGEVDPVRVGLSSVQSIASVVGVVAVAFCR